MMLSPPSSKKLSSMPTRSSPSTSANSAHRISSCGVRGARRTVVGARSGAGSARRSSLPFGVSGSRSSTTNAARHHVVRKAPTKMRPQRRRIRCVSTRSRHHIGHQPLVARRHPRAQSPPPAPHSDAAPAPPRSRQARCGSRASSPGCPHAQESPEPRPHASAPGPRCGTSGSPQDQTGPQQTAPPSAPHDPDSPAQDPHPHM